MGYGMGTVEALRPPADAASYIDKCFCSPAKQVNSNAICNQDFHSNFCGLQTKLLISIVLGHGLQLTPPKDVRNIKCSHRKVDYNPIQIL